jgi:hypothetical protein
VPVYHDAEPSEYETFARFASELPVVVHLLKIYPAYKDILLPATTDKRLKQVASLFEKNHLYIHPSIDSDDTRCPRCREVLVRRSGLSATLVRAVCCGCTIIKA